MIQVHEHSKRYGTTTALDNLSFTVEPGKVTGFLGPNGAGKSTAMRIILGLDRPDTGTAHINGKPYRALTQPLRAVGSLLDAQSFHPGRSAYNHLLALARTHGIHRNRVDEVLELTGLSAVSHRSPETYSLGMGQRLGLASALLGDPPILLLDEPMNGLDAEGMNWMRRLLPSLAQEGRAVFVSSHLMSEVSQVADRVVVVGRGRLIADTTVTEFVAQAGGVQVHARTSEPEQLATVLKSEATSVDLDTNNQTVATTGLTLTQVGELAPGAGILVYELNEELPSLEEAFLRLTSDDAIYVGRSA